MIQLRHFTDGGNCIRYDVLLEDLIMFLRLHAGETYGSDVRKLVIHARECKNLLVNQSGPRIQYVYISVDAPCSRRWNHNFSLT